jgi:hypothetical protein
VALEGQLTLLGQEPLEPPPLVGGFVAEAGGFVAEEPPLCELHVLCEMQLLLFSQPQPPTSVQHIG